MVELAADADVLGTLSVRVAETFILLKGRPNFTQQPIFINGNGKYRGEIKDLRLYNYSIDEQEVQKLAAIRASTVCKSIFIGEKLAEQPFEIPHADLPHYDNTFSLHFWMRNSVKYTGEMRNVFTKGTFQFI